VKEEGGIQGGMLPFLTELTFLKVLGLVGRMHSGLAR